MNPAVPIPQRCAIYTRKSASASARGDDVRDVARVVPRIVLSTPSATGREGG
jgi:hypothetical protein